MNWTREWSYRLDKWTLRVAWETGSIPREEGGRGAIQEEGKSNAVSVQTGETFL